MPYQRIIITVVVCEVAFVKYKRHYFILRSLGSSVSIVSDDGMDDRAIVVRSPVEANYFSSSLLCPYRLWGPPNLLYNGYRGLLSPGVKRGRGVTLTSHPHLVPKSRMSRSYTLPH
jgi:hypothetical protein